MKKFASMLSLELGPTIAFVLSYQITKSLGISLSIILIATIVCSIIYFYIHRSVSYINLCVFTINMVFYIYAYYFSSFETVIFRDTVYGLFIGVGCIISLFTKKTLLEMLLGLYFELSSEGWRHGTLNIGAFFILISVCNELFRYFDFYDYWVTYKLLKYVGIFLFVYYFKEKLAGYSLNHSKTFGLRL